MRLTFVCKCAGGGLPVVEVGERERCEVAPWPKRSLRFAGAAPPCRCTHDPRAHMEHHQQQQPQQAEQRRPAVVPTQHHRPCAVIGPDRQPYPQRHPDMNVRHQILQPHQPLQVIQQHPQLHQPLHQVYTQTHRHVDATKPHPYERYEVDYPLNARDVPFNVDYDYQSYPAQVVHNQTACQKMPERVSYEYPGVAYPRPPIATRYEPYPQVKEKYMYQYSYQNPYTFIDQRKRPKTQAEELQYCQVSRHPQPFYPTPKVQTSAPCGVIDQKYGHPVGPYHARMKQYMPPPYDVNAVNAKVADPNKLKMDYYNHYRTPTYPNMHYPNENYHAANYNLPGYDYSARSPNMHYQNPMYYKPVDYRQSEKTYEVDPAAHKYYNSKFVSGNPLARIPTEFSPNIISPAGSNTSFDSMAANSYQTLQEDGGYVSQCSTVSRQSAEYQVNAKKDFYSQSCSRPYQSASSLETLSPKTSVLGKSQSANKESLDVRKFFENWNEDYEDSKVSNAEGTTAEPTKNCMQSKSETEKAYVPEQLYVLDKTVISEEEVKKYEHVQKVTKLPEYIKDVGVANPDRTNMNSKKDINFPYPTKLQAKKDTPMVYNTYRNNVQPIMKVPQPELFTSEFEDVEAKISQSVIHKEVRCNFEIKPLISTQVTIPNNTIPVEEPKIKSVTPTTVPYKNNVQTQKNEKSANMNYSKVNRKVLPEVTNNNYLPLQNQMNQKKSYPNVVHPNMSAINHKNIPSNYNSLPIINTDETTTKIPINHAKQEIHYTKLNPMYANYADAKTLQQHTLNTHGKVNVIMNSAYVDYKTPQVDVGSRRSIPNCGQPIFKSPYGTEYKSTNANFQQQNSKQADSFNMNYVNKMPSQNNYFNISINSEKGNPHYPNYIEQYPPKPSERIVNSKFVKPHEEKSVNKTTNINIALTLNEDKKNNPENTNNRTVICRNDSNNINKNNQETCEQYLDSESGVLYSSRNASITIQIEKRDELEYPNFSKDHVSENNVQQYPVPDPTFNYTQNEHLNGTTHNTDSYQNNLADKSYELKIYETQAEDVRSNKKSIIMHSSFQQNNDPFVPENFSSNYSDHLNQEHYPNNRQNDLTKTKKESNFKSSYPVSDIHPGFIECQYEALLKQNPEQCISNPSVIDMSYKTNKNNSVIVKSSGSTVENSSTVINSGVIIRENSLKNTYHKLPDENVLSNKPLTIAKNDSVIDSDVNPLENKTSPIIVEQTIKSAIESSLPIIESEFFENDVDSNSVEKEIPNSILITEKIDDLTHSSKQSDVPELIVEKTLENEPSLGEENKNNCELPDNSTTSVSHDSSSDSESDSSDNQSDTSEIQSDSKEDETSNEQKSHLNSNECETTPITEENRNENTLDNDKLSDSEKFKVDDMIELECSSKEEEISEESEPLIDFQDSLTNAFTKNNESNCMTCTIADEENDNESSNDNQNMPTNNQSLEEKSTYDEFQMVFEKNFMQDNESDCSLSKINKNDHNGNNLSKHELIIDDNDGISFKNNDCEVTLETVPVDEQETYISFESNKADIYSDEDDAHYVIIRADEQLSYAAIDSENDLSSDAQISKVALEDSEISREKLNMGDGNEIEIGAYWIDDIACVETVAAEETVEAEETVITEEAEAVYEEDEMPLSNETYIPDETFNDSTEFCKSPSVAWSENSSNDESNSASIDFNNHDDSSNELLKDSNSNFITSDKDHIKENSNDVSVFDKFSLEEQMPKNSGSCNLFETKEEFRNPIKVKLSNSFKNDSKTIERRLNNKEKHSKKRVREDESKSPPISTKRKKYSSPDGIKKESSKYYSKSMKNTKNDSYKNTNYHSSASESKSSNSRSYSSDAKTDVSDRSRSRNRMTLPKKQPKPKFEDVLKNLDEANMSFIKMKLKKQKKKSIPKVIIKRNEEGSHYTSTPNKVKPLVIKNKWQPQVCLRRNNSIDKMLKSK